MLNSKPILSIIIPAIKVDLELKRCIDSIRLACSFDSNLCEIVLVTPPCQVEVAKAVVEGVNTFVSETRKGIYAAMNDGIRASRGRHLFFLGKDDIVLPPFGQILNQLTQEGNFATFFDVYWGKEGVYSSRPSKWRVLLRNFCHQGIIYSREVIDAHGPYISRFRVQADHLLNIRLLWDSRFSAGLCYYPGGRVWYAAEGFSSLTHDPLFWRLYPLILKRYVSPVAGVLLSASRWMRGKYI
jgi:glycosyltransferase involved in cell wall biosynthesis